MTFGVRAGQKSEKHGGGYEYCGEMLYESVRTSLSAAPCSFTKSSAVFACLVVAACASATVIAVFSTVKEMRATSGGRVACPCPCTVIVSVAGLDERPMFAATLMVLASRKSVRMESTP